MGGGQFTKGWDHFYVESWPLKTPYKGFNLVIGVGLGWFQNGSKMDREKVIFMQLFTHCILFVGNCIG